MPRRPCTSCGEAPRSKLASIYTSWFENDARIAYRLVICYDCVVKHIGPYVKRSIGARAAGICNDCGLDKHEPLRPMWLTVYMPGVPEDQVDLRFCEECTPAVREDLVTRSTGAELPDRQGVGGRQPLVDIDWSSVW